MSEVSQDALKLAQKEDHGIKEVNPGIWRGPWRKEMYDNYTECLKENQDTLRIRELKAEGLNSQGQTKEQEGDFNNRKAEATDKKERAAVLSEAALSNK